MGVLSEVQQSIKAVRGKLEQAIVGVGNHRGIGSGVVVADDHDAPEPVTVM
ncbi:MAG: hypothetical protein ACXVQ6_09610 [Actinomycetota bacterium]